MSSFLPWFLVGFFASGIVVAVLALRPTTTKSAESWSVEVAQASDLCGGYDYHWGKPIEGEIAVRLRCGKQMLTVGTARVKNPTFEQDLHRLIADAEEKAMSLNAVMT